MLGVGPVAPAFGAFFAAPAQASQGRLQCYEAGAAAAG